MTAEQFIFFFLGVASAAPNKYSSETRASEEAWKALVSEAEKIAGRPPVATPTEV